MTNLTTVPVVFLKTNGGVFIRDIPVPMVLGKQDIYFLDKPQLVYKQLDSHTYEER